MALHENFESFSFFFLEVVHQFTNIHQQMAEILVQKYGVSSFFLFAFCLFV